MNNHRIARIVEGMADLLEIKGGQPFRVRAYRQAAAHIDELPESLEQIAKRGDLERVPGVGTSIAERIRDIIETGTTPLYEELKSQVPEGLIDVLAIPGIGPKTVKILHDKLGITSTDELRQAAREKRIRTATDLGNKAEMNILRWLDAAREGDRRVALGVALPLVEEMIERIRRSPSVRQISEAGSIRRRKDTIGDIDIVVESTDVGATTDAFIHMPQVAEVIETGRTMDSVMTRQGLRVDLRMASQGQFGAMLHHFTGSKLHNIRLRGLARDKGLTINDYGVFRVDSGDQVTAGNSEADIYSALGLPWIPTELREDRGEIEAAIEGRLPTLVDINDIRGDLHVHTRATDGTGTLDEIADRARGLGYGYIAICDHSRSLSIAHGLSDERLLAQIEEIRALNERLDGLRILAGLEVDILEDGSLDADPAILATLDIVVGSVHTHHQQDRETMTRRVIRGIETGLVDIFAHPTGRMIGSREPIEIDLDRVFAAALAHSTAMEINSTPDRLDLNDTYARAAKDKGLKLAINTDAHSISDLSNTRYGLAMARRAWLEPSDVINTWPLDALMRWRRGRAV